MVTVYVSAMHSGANPSPGLGLARSLGALGDDVHIIAVDYSPSASGLHAPEADDLAVLPAWAEIEVPSWKQWLDEKLVTPCTYFIPGFDLEVELAARVWPNGREGLLCVDGSTLKRASKLALAEFGCVADLDLPRPDALRGATTNAIASFVRSSPSGVWVKGAHHDAIRAWNYREVIAARGQIEHLWNEESFLERHVDGNECSLVFAAWHGQLLGIAYMDKLQQTPEGKTWAGDVSSATSELFTKCNEFVRASGWHGGGEIEMIRSSNGDHFLIEVNPRFPAWIHGASLGGLNLPVLLVDAARGHVPGQPMEPTSSSRFTRVVSEVSVKPTVGFPRAVADGALGRMRGKHPSGMTELARRLHGTERIGAAGASHDRALPALPSDLNDKTLTPLHLLDVGSFREEVRRLQSELGSVPRARLAHSIKTDPSIELLHAARDLGMLAEAISQDEVELALSAGFDRSEVVLNGPAKLWPPRKKYAAGYVFADSLEDLRAILAAPWEHFPLVGVRVGLSWWNSRFGLQLDRLEVLTEVVDLLARHVAMNRRWGLHFHRAPRHSGGADWREFAGSVLSYGELLARELGRSPQCVDFGGGWQPGEAGAMVAAIRQQWIGWATEAEVLMEPGKLLSQASGSVLTRVIGRRGEDVIVDASIAEVPEAAWWPHPLDIHAPGGWRAMRRGRGRVLGRSCIEEDVLAEGVETAAVVPGTLLAVRMAGAYDRSMTYSFARGGRVTTRSAL